MKEIIIAVVVILLAISVGLAFAQHPIYRSIDHSTAQGWGTIRDFGNAYKSWTCQAIFHDWTSLPTRATFSRQGSIDGTNFFHISDHQAADEVDMSDISNGGAIWYRAAWTSTVGGNQGAGSVTYECLVPIGRTYR